MAPFVIHHKLTDRKGGMRFVRSQPASHTQTWCTALRGRVDPRPRGGGPTGENRRPCCTYALALSVPGGSSAPAPLGAKGPEASTLKAQRAPRPRGGM